MGVVVQSPTGSRGVGINGSNAGYTMFRGSVKSTGYPLHSPVSPSLPLPASPCAITFQLDSTHFCYRPSQSQGHSADGRIMSMKNSNATIGNRTLEIPACSAVPQPTPPPAPPSLNVHHANLHQYCRRQHSFFNTAHTFPPTAREPLYITYCRAHIPALMRRGKLGQFRLGRGRASAIKHTPCISQ